MMQADQLRQAKNELSEALSKLPFDINRASGTRIAAWKAASAKGRKVLNRNSRDPKAYFAAAANLRYCATAPVEQLHNIIAGKA